MSFGDYSPVRFPRSSGPPIIAPFWADADTQGSGRVWFRERSENQELLNRAQSDIQQYFGLQPDFSPNFLFIATWDQVPHYNLGNKVLLIVIH